LPGLKLGYDEDYPRNLRGLSPEGLFQLFHWEWPFRRVEPGSIGPPNFTPQNCPSYETPWFGDKIKGWPRN